MREDPYNFFRSDASLALYDTLAMHLSEITREGSTKKFFTEQYTLYKRLVGPTIQKVAPHVMAAMDAQKTPTYATHDSTLLYLYPPLPSSTLLYLTLPTHICSAWPWRPTLRPPSPLKEAHSESRASHLQVRRPLLLGRFHG